MIVIILYSIVVMGIGLYVLMNYLYNSGKVKALNAPISRTLYMVLSFTWGLPMNIAGGLVALILLLRGHRARKMGWAFCFPLDVNFGLSLGIFAIVPKGLPKHTIMHEFGHSIQNIYLGPFFPFLVALPSAIRFHYRDYVKSRNPKKHLPDYDAIWFEGQATATGEEFFSKEEKE